MQMPIAYLQRTKNVFRQERLPMLCLVFEK